MKRALRLALLGLLGLAVLGALALAVYAWRALPRTQGSLELQGLASEVSIARDVDGVPTIRAGSLEDAMFGLGFAHAQDRLWQLETHRRIASGRLAEAFGPAAVESDRFLRALGVRRAAAAQWSVAQGETRGAVEAYARGINAFLAEAMQARPPEFLLLGVKPEPWQPEDTLGWAIMMAWDLGGNWSSELFRLRLAAAGLAPERIVELLPPDPGEATITLPDYRGLLRQWQVADSFEGHDAGLARLAEAAPESGIEGVGSNNWVVNGAHSVTGRPLLANDPHLKLSAPALWYFARIEVPGLRLAGATLPGLPFVVLGQNEHVAWGFTNTNPDVQDLYLERVAPADPGRYLTPDGTAAFERWHETIRVKGGPDVVLDVRATRHGPVLSDAIEGLPLEPGKAVLALRWTALDADVGTLEAGLGFNRARSVAEFVAASARYVAPMQNMVVADRDGHIGEVSAGRVPLRRPDNELKGQMPAPGWDARYDWAGFIAPDQTPRELDPARGSIATANQRITPADYPHYLTSEWAPPYRQQRIEQLLAARPRHDLQSFAAIQADQLSLATVRLLPFLRHARASHPLAAAAQRALDPQAFDGRMDGASPGALIFWAWVRQLTHGIFADELGESLYERSGRTFREALEGVLERDDAWWCDDKGTPDVKESCAQQVDAAFARALDELQALQGPDVAGWRWDQAHVARAEHRPFSKVPALAKAFELRAPVGGDTYTVNVSRVAFRADAITGERYLDEHGPSLRALYDVGDPTRSLFMFSSGQSGLLHSPLYRNLVTPWRRVEYRPLWGGAAGGGDVLRLMPRRQ